VTTVTPISLEGQTLGKYRVLEPLGRGGMAQVHRAYHPQLERYVAIKVLRSDLVEEEEFLARFKREARSVSALRHTNIVQVYDFDIQDDLYYMVMELLEGDTLKAHINSYRTRGEHMPFSEMVRILVDVLEGLRYAHSEGITHRDIKPANILLTRRGQAVITDFGIAQIVGGTQYTVSGALMGTLHYMAPEQGLEGHGDNRSDLYSLGIVFYELLTGQPPFDADTPLAILMKHVNDPLPLPRKIDPTIPEPFERVLLKVLAKRPEDRYQTAEEMAQALRDAARQAGVDIPQAISLPPVAAVVAGSVAVYSGKARQAIPDAAFAADDTDSTLGQRLRAAQADPTQLAAEPIRIQRLPEAALGTAAGLIIFNSLAAFLSTVVGLDILGRGWPIELFLASFGLGLLMSALALPWLLIPAGIVLGNGVILSYFALTDFWTHWIFMWPLEPFLVIGVAAVTLRLARQGEAGRRASRRLGMALAAASLAVIPPVLAIATFLSIFLR
jgi:tRNA A-37 threonylcarbamoyl transferase component Bud32